MVRTLIIWYSFVVRSERRMRQEFYLYLAYRWFCRLGLEDPVSNHLTFLKNRHDRFLESDVFSPRNSERGGALHEGEVVSGKGFAVDTSLIQAEANRSRRRARAVGMSTVANSTLPRYRPIDRDKMYP